MLNKLKNGHWPVFLLSSFSSMGNLFLPIILVRILSPDEVGYYKIFFLHLMAIPFLFMTGGPVHSVFYWVGKEENEKIKSLNSTWVLTIVLSLLVLLVGLPFYHELSRYLNMPAEYVVLMLFAGALWCPAGHYSETTIAMGRSGRGSLFDTLFEVIKTCGFLLLALLYKDIKYLFIFYPSLLLIKLLINAWLNYKENGISYQFDRTAVARVAKYCFPVSFAGCLGFFVDKIDMLILSAKLEASDFAFYSMGCLIIPPLYLLEMSVQKVLIPNLSKDFTNKDKNSSAKHFRKGVSDISLLVIPSIFGLITFADPIVELLYTREYIASSLYLKIFALSYILLIFPHDSAARATGNTGWILKMYLLVTPISILFGYISVSYWGAIGILIASILVKAIPKFCGLYFSKNLMGWKWHEMFPHRKLFLYIISAGSLSIISIILKDFFNDDMKWFLSCAPVFAASYLSITYVAFRKVVYAKTAV